MGYMVDVFWIIFICANVGGMANVASENAGIIIVEARTETLPG